MRAKRRVVWMFLMAASGLAAETLPVSVWYGGGKARAPMLEPDPAAKREAWRQDLLQIRGLGFNTIRCWIDWASGEPAEGEYRFDTLEVLAGLAEELGLKVVVQVYMDSAPMWLGRKYPGARFVSSNGAVIVPESAPGYCRDHPEVGQADRKFYEALGARFGRRAALLGWDLWSEPHVINWATPTYLPNPEFCFCPHTLRRFRGWLQKKYRTLEALNQAWYRQYAAWDEVEPSRLSTILSYRDYLDWKAFIVDKLGEDLRDRYQAVKRVAPAKLAVSHAAGVGLFASPHWWEGQSDDWAMARQVDYYGTSFYPKHSAHVDRDVYWRAALLDFTRSFGFFNGGRGFWVGELQAGFGTIALSVSRPVTPRDLRIWMWSALARGAKGLHLYAWYPMSTGYESGGFGLIHLDGTITGRARVAGAVAQTVARSGALLASARPAPASVAIVYNPLAHFVGGRQRATAYGGPQGEIAGIERDSLLGIHRALFGEQVDIDYLHVQHLSESLLSGYRLVFLPYPLMLPEAAVRVLARYIEHGGALVTEARFGWNDERGRASGTIPGMGFAGVAGAKESTVESAPAARTVLVWDTEDFPGIRRGARIAGRGFRETLEPLRGSSRVVARYEDGTPAAIAATHGKGQVLTLGSYVSAAFQIHPESGAARLFPALLNWAGVPRPLAVEPAGPEVRRLVTSDGLLLVVLNHETTPWSGTVRLSEPRKVSAVTDLETNQAAPFSMEGDQVRFAMSLGDGGVRVLYLRLQ